MNEIILKLFITGQSYRSEHAIHNLDLLCEHICQELGDQVKVIVVDVLEQPQLAEEERILATPTLVKESPPPLRRIIGDLSDIQKVRFGLGL